jgi:hypothetical protein
MLGLFPLFGKSDFFCCLGWILQFVAIIEVLVAVDFPNGFGG